MRRFSIFVLLFFLSCNGERQENDFEVPQLEDKIKAFINAQKCFTKTTKFLMVNLDARHDTLQLEFADSYPDIQKLTFKLDTVLYGKRIIFTGDNIRGFSRKSLKTGFPPDIVKDLEDNPDLLFYEYTLWLYLFKNGQLINKDTPCSEPIQK